MNFYRIEYLAKYFSTASNQLSRFSFPSTHFVYINIYTKYIYTNNIYTNIYTTNCVSWNAGKRVWMYDRVYKVWRAQLAWETK